MSYGLRFLSLTLLLSGSALCVQTDMPQDASGQQSSIKKSLTKQSRAHAQFQIHRPGDPAVGARLKLIRAPHPPASASASAAPPYADQ